MFGEWILENEWKNALAICIGQNFPWFDLHGVLEEFSNTSVGNWVGNRNWSHGGLISEGCISHNVITVESGSSGLGHLPKCLWLWGCCSFWELNEKGVASSFSKIFWVGSYCVSETITPVSQQALAAMEGKPCWSQFHSKQNQKISVGWAQ